MTLNVALRDLWEDHKPEFEVLHNEDSILAMALAHANPGVLRQDLIAAIGPSAASLEGFELASANHFLDIRHDRVWLQPTGLALLDELGLNEGRLAGLKGAFNEVWVKRQVSLFRYAAARLGSLDAAEECLQQAALRAYQALGTFRGESDMATWIASILRNVVTDYLRDQARRRARDVYWNDLLESKHLSQAVDVGTHDPAHIIENEELSLLTAKGLAEMRNRRFREALELRYLDGYSYPRIARVLNVTPAAARTIVYRAKKAFASTPTIAGLVSADNT
ncbi:MAG: RNA polymerase sigma factor [Dehalococcoidia bacterium]